MKSLIVLGSAMKYARYALLMAYDGSTLHGMMVQKSPLIPTVESHLFKAMRECEWLPRETEDELGDILKLEFNRASKTDKGVSAAHQLVSMKLPKNEELPVTGASDLNKLLPEFIRIVAIRRVTARFSARRFCDARTYNYILPTYSFASSDELTNINYRISEKRLYEVSDLMDRFRGTRNFFNYTAAKPYTDKSIMRHIFAFEIASKPFLYRDEKNNVDVEFVTVRVKGGSFMLHQIRKMIGTVIQVTRNVMSPEDFDKSFESERMNIPRAPGLGLFLERLHYGGYDNQHGQTHELLDKWGEEVERELEEVKQKLVVNNILRNECETYSMMEWLNRPARNCLDYLVNFHEEAERVELENEAVGGGQSKTDGGAGMEEKEAVVASVMN